MLITLHKNARTTPCMVRPATMNVAPEAASSMHVAAPMPEPPPVTMMVFPSKRRSIDASY